jgi:membrane-bound ClpP family serine protease
MPPKKKKNSKSNKSNFWSNAKDAFAFGLGGFLAAAIYGLIGTVLFIAGYVLKNKEDAKEKDQQVQWKKYVGIGLMILGVALGGGRAIFTLIGEVAEEI